MEPILASLSLEKKLGQLLMIGISGTDMNAETRGLLADLDPGAVILLGRNVREPKQLASFCAGLQSGAAIPRFIAMDQEGGIVVRLSRGATVFPGAMATGATGSTNLAFLEGKIAGAELRALGVNMNLAPVLDVNSNRKNPVIGVRAYGDDPLRVAQMGKSYALGLQDSGVAAVAKHFPGHGDSVEDSHAGLPTIAADLTRLRSLELVPFAAAAKAGVDAMMTAHLLFPAIDTVPATLSKKILTDLLRGELGFQGILMSDDLEMKAIEGTYGIGPAAAKSIEAGADMLMVIWHRASKDAAVEHMRRAVEKGDLSMERVDEAVRRILTIKAKRGLFGAMAPPVAMAAVGSPHHRKIAREIARRAITVVTNDGALPLGQSTKKLAVVSASDEFLAQLRAVRRGAIEIHLPQRPDAAARRRVVAGIAALARDTIVVSVSNGEQAALAAEIAGKLGAKKQVVGVALGSPYLLDGVERLAAHVCAYGWRPDSVRAAVRVLTGLDAAVGVSPVRLASSPSEAPIAETTKL